MHDQDPSKPNHIPGIVQVTEAYQDILAHNDEHTGFGPAFGQVFNQLLDDNEIIDYTGEAPEPEPPVAEPAGDTDDDTTTRGDMSADLQEIVHGETFTRIGIKLAPFGTQMQRGEGERVGSTELVPMIENSSLFSEFLSGLRTEELQKEGRLDLMMDAIKTLKKTINACFRDPGSSDPSMTEEQRKALAEYGEDCLRTFITIDPEYRRLGIREPQDYKAAPPDASRMDPEEARVYERFSDSTGKVKGYFQDYKELERYVEYWGRGVLTQYLEVSDRHLLEDGPKTVYFDGLQDKLEEDVEYILKLQRNPETQQFGQEVASSFMDSIRVTVRAMDEDPDGWFVSSENRELLEKAKARLEQDKA